MPTDIIEMFWECKSKGCPAQLGRHKVCQACGRPKDDDCREWLPDDISHESKAVVHEDSNPDLFSKFTAGPDWKCRFCGSKDWKTDGSCFHCGAPNAGDPPPAEPRHETPPPPPSRHDDDDLPGGASGGGGIDKARVAMAVCGVGAVLGLGYCALRPTDHPATVTDAQWSYAVHVDREDKVPGTGFDVPAGAEDVVNEGKQFSHNDQVFDHNETVYYDETIQDPPTCITTPVVCHVIPRSCTPIPRVCRPNPPVCHDPPKICKDIPRVCKDIPRVCRDIPKSCTTIPGTCTTTPRSCKSNKNGSATCTGGDRVCSPDRQSCTGGGQSCSGGGQDCTGGGQDCRSGGPAICIPVPDTCTGGGEDCVPEHRDCTGGDQVCTPNSHVEHKSRIEARYRPVPVYRDHFKWTTWQWSHNRDLPQGAHDTNVLTLTPEQLGVVAHERVAGVDPVTCSVTFTTTDDHKTYEYKPADCAGAFQTLPIGAKRRLKVGPTGSIEIVVPKK